MNRKIYGWTLNFYNQNDGSLVDVPDSWSVCAYPFDVNEDNLGDYNTYIVSNLTNDEVDSLHLGYDSNLYASDSDWWAGCDWFIQEYPHPIPSRIMAWLEALPTDTDSIDRL